jgi:hypothetical protein
VEAVRGYRHLAAARTLGQLDLAGAPPGVLLGRYPDGRAAVVPLFAPRPVRVVLLGGPWALRLLLFRALGAGARLAVRTSHPQQAHAFGHWATGRDGYVSAAAGTLPATGPPGPDGKNRPPGPGRPLLVVEDPGAPAPPAERGAPGAWRTELSVAPADDDGRPPGADPADLVICQRLPPSRAEARAAARDLAPRWARKLAELPEDQLAILADGSGHLLRCDPTAVEREAFGPPRR